ncbi:unnamed protein product [Cuscuta campestris]|uniref:Secreted protein n=1 Tax=Cuscuta campestris TaxID=132261 RepID=A0A484KVD5_9ASTE|nr:unnamed protein product [Cuscuta campestris]
MCCPSVFSQSSLTLHWHVVVWLRVCWQWNCRCDGVAHSHSGINVLNHHHYFNRNLAAAAALRRSSIACVLWSLTGRRIVLRKLGCR